MAMENYAIYDTKAEKALLDETFKSKDAAKVVRNKMNLEVHGESYNETKILENGNIIFPNRYGCRYKICRTDAHPRGASYKK